MSEELWNTWNMLLAAALGFAIGSAFWISVLFSYHQRSAVDHHAAEYYLDTNHERQFCWLDEKKP